MNIAVPADCTERFLKSANTPHLKGGCEPKLLVAAGAIAFLCAMWLMNRWGFVLAIFVFLVGRALARRMAQEDPYMTKILMDSIKYATFYPAKSLQGIVGRVRA